MTRPQRHPLPWCEPERLLTGLTGSLERPGLVWLDSDGSALGRTSLLAVDPLEEVVCRGLPGDTGSADPFAALARLQAGGGIWLGWLAYEAGAWLEPGPHWQRPAMAVLWAIRVDPLLVFDHGERQLWLEGHDRPRLERLGRHLEGLISAETPIGAEASGLALPRHRWRWHTDPEGFAAGVAQLRQRIAAGDLFQANLSACCEQQLDAPPSTADLLTLYGRLRRRCPAPFAGLAIAGAGGASGEAVLSASPERFLRLDADRLVETRPIKGTRPRHADPLTDAAAAADLVSSPKDRAENVMIVDLLRNDLGRVCEPGSVRVPQLVGLESYSQVHHLTSVVRGRLRAGLGPAELLRACWPGGSISGAPKIRASQRLNELEPLPRGPYCGSLFYLDGQGGFDSSILIRSLFLQDRCLRVHAGCGIVADSEPEAEAEELGWKIEPLLVALEADQPGGTGKAEGR
jgi:para-aminobenzoate synthetase component 1